MPTSRATRVTSEVNTPSCLIIVLTMVAERRNSPCSGRPSTSSRTVCSRSPCATAVMACVTAVVGHSRSSIRSLTEVSISPQAPLCRPNLTRVPGLALAADHLADMRQLCAMRSLAATISLNVSAILPSSPVWSLGRRTEKSPIRMACSACSSSCMPNGVAVQMAVARLTVLAGRCSADCRVGRDPSTGLPTSVWSFRSMGSSWRAGRERFGGLAALWRASIPPPGSLRYFILRELLAVYSPYASGRPRGRRPRTCAVMPQDPARPQRTPDRKASDQNCKNSNVIHVRAPHFRNRNSVSDFRRRALARGITNY